MDVIKDQMPKLQTEIQEIRRLLNLEDYEVVSKQELKEEIEYKEEQLMELQREMDEANVALPRRSERCGVQTEKMLVYQIGRAHV